MPAMTRSSACSKSFPTISWRCSRPAMIAASLQMLARSAPVRPLVWRATSSRSTSRSGLSLVCTSRIWMRPLRSGGETKIWRSKRPGRSRAGSSLSSRFEAAITTTSSLAEKPSSSTSSWLSVWSFSPGHVVAAGGAHRVELVDEHDRRGLPCAPPGTGAGSGRRRARRTSPRTTTPTARRRWPWTRWPRPWRGASCRCRAGRGRGCPLGTWAPSDLKRLGSRRNSTTSRSSAFASSTPATSSQRTAPDDSRLDLLRLGARHVAQREPEHAATIAPMKMIGSQMSAKSWSEFQNEPPPPPPTAVISNVSFLPCLKIRLARIDPPAARQRLVEPCARSAADGVAPGSSAASCSARPRGSRPS